MNSIPKILLVVVIAACSAVVHGSVIVSVSDFKPTTDVIEQFDATTTNFNSDCTWIPYTTEWPFYGARHRDVGQSFSISTPRDTWIDKITLKLGSLSLPPAGSVASGVYGAQFHFELWTMANVGDYTGDVLLSWQAGTFPSSNLNHQYWTLDIENVLISPGNTYAFLVSFDAEAASRYFWLTYGYGEEYGNGRQISRMDGLWQSSPYRDVAFFAQGELVPEPSTLIIWSLIGGIGIAIARWRRKR